MHDPIPTWDATRLTNLLLPLFPVLRYETAVQSLILFFLNTFSPLYILRREVKDIRIYGFLPILFTASSNREQGVRGWGECGEKVTLSGWKEREQINPTIAYGPLLPTPQGHSAQSNASNFGARGTDPVLTVLPVIQQPEASHPNQLSCKKRKAVTSTRLWA